MKLDTLARYFERTKRTKLFVVTDAYVVAGRASRPSAPKGDVLLVDFAPFVAYFFDGGGLVRGSETFGPVRLDDGVRVTRRLQTHRRHVADKQIPEGYFEACEEL